MTAHKRKPMMADIVKRMSRKTSPFEFEVNSFSEESQEIQNTVLTTENSLLTETAGFNNRSIEDAQGYEQNESQSVVSSSVGAQEQKRESIISSMVITKTPRRSKGLNTRLNFVQSTKHIGSPQTEQNINFQPKTFYLNLSSAKNGPFDQDYRSRHGSGVLSDRAREEPPLF